MLFALCIFLIIMFFVVGIGLINSRDDETTTMLGFCFILGAAFGAVCLYAGLEQKEKDAVKAGAGHYQMIVDKEGNVSNQFVWGPKKE